jgi:hypothetical protein
MRSVALLPRVAPVFAVIVGGEPGDADRECFPPALRVKIAPDSTPTGEPEEPIAADARPEGDGKPMALLKVAPFDNVRKREALRISAIAGPQAERAREPRGLLGPARAWRHRAIPRQGSRKLPGYAIMRRPSREGRPRQRRLAVRIQEKRRN